MKTKSNPVLKFAALFFLIFCFSCFLIACPQEPDIKNTVTQIIDNNNPPKIATAVITGKVLNNVDPSRTMDNFKIYAISQGTEFGFGTVDPKTGDYSVTVPKAGTYDLRMKCAAGVVEFNYAIPAKAGQTAKAPDILLPADALPPKPIVDVEPPSTTTPATTVSKKPDDSRENASVQGSVFPNDAEVIILDGDKIVAKGTAADGKFNVPNVQPGLYDVQITAPGFTIAKLQNVAVAATGVTAPINAALLYKTPIPGVDYDKGTITASGVGIPNPKMPPAQAAAGTCTAARVVAYRNLLDTVLMLQYGKDKSVRSLDSDGKLSTKLQGYVKGAKVVKEEKRADGTCEVTLEIPLYGSAGVVGYIRKAIGK